MVVGKLAGVGLGIALMDPTHRYAGLTLHLTPGSSPVLRHAIRADGAVWASHKPHIADTETHEPFLVAWKVLAENSNL